MRRIFDGIARRLARLLVRIFFRAVESTGLERVPAAGPIVFVANHGNSLIDPFVLVAVLPRYPRFLAKSTLWGNPAVRPLLELGGVVPVYRRQDQVDTSRNRETFARCHEELARGGAVALFPEGISHDEAALQPMRTGAARIALEAESERGPLGVCIVPVGLTFDAKGLFRSRALVNVGAPIDLAPELTRHGADPAEAVRALTARIREQLAAVTLNYASWQQARLIERAVDIYARAESELPGRPELAERFSLRQTFGASYAEVERRHPERVDALARQVSRYDELLQQLGLRDDQVASAYRRGQVVRYVAVRLATLLLWFPVAAVGTALNWIPYRVAGVIADRLSSAPDQPATYKALAGFFLLPATWAAEVAGATALAGFRGGLLMALIAPLSGYLALLFHERHESFWSEVIAFVTLRFRRGRASELRARRRGVQEAVSELVAAQLAAAGSQPSGR